MNWLKLIDKGITEVTRWSAAIAGVILVGMVLLIAANVIGRYGFVSPVKGATEILRIVLVGVVFLAIAHIQMQRRHIRVTVFSAHFPPSVQLLSDCAMHMLAMGVMVIMAWRAVLFAQMAWAAHYTSMVMGIDIGTTIMVVTVGAALAFLAFLYTLVRDVNELLKRERRLCLWLIPIGVMAVVILIAPLWLDLLPFEVGRLEVGILGFLFMLVLMFLGAPVGTAMFVTGFIGVSYITGLSSGLAVMATVSYSTATAYGWVVIPLFILMGNLVGQGGLARDVYRTVHTWVGHFPGGLAMATVGGCAGFAAACGDSLSTAMTMGRVSLPEMRRHKYDMKLATGCLAAGGTLGILIPPSLGFIIYGIMCEQSIGKLFVAGIFPGIMLAVLFMSTIYIRVRRNPSLATLSPNTSFKEKLLSLRGTIAILALFILVIGGIYIGMFSPSEGGGIGAFGTILIGLIMRRWSRQGFTGATSEAVVMNGAVFYMLMGAMILGHFVAIAQIPTEIGKFLLLFIGNKWMVLALVFSIYIIMGCVMNIMPAMIITLPIIFPIMVSLGFDPIWFGVILVINMEMGQITPPVGINVFGISVVAPDVPMGTIFAGIVPFLLMQLVAIGILVAFPQIATFLPSLR